MQCKMEFKHLGESRCFGSFPQETVVLCFFFFEETIKASQAK